ncbi:MAG: helix-turn-helix domain-containing protein [Planctomycetota bacterium]
MSNVARYLTPPEIARMWGTSVKKVLAFIDSQELPAIDLATNRGSRPRWKVTPEALAQFELTRRSLPAQPSVARRSPRKRDTAHVIQFV